MRSIIIQIAIYILSSVACQVNLTITIILKKIIYVIVIYLVFSTSYAMSLIS